MNGLVNDYFEWMYRLVSDESHLKRLSYRKLLMRLHDTEFLYSIPLDGNRAEDGIDLRYRFGYENGVPDAEIASVLDQRPCSVLEMLVALSVRCEEHIMDNPDIGNRTGQWFWAMIVNLGLGSMTDDDFDKGLTDQIIRRFLNREYRSNGDGGLFLLQKSGRDLRGVEIWYQMMWYLEEIVGN